MAKAKCWVRFKNPHTDGEGARYPRDHECQLDEAVADGLATYGIVARIDGPTPVSPDRTGEVEQGGDPPPADPPAGDDDPPADPPPADPPAKATPAPKKPAAKKPPAKKPATRKPRARKPRARKSAAPKKE